MRRTIMIDFNSERNPDMVVSPVQIYENEKIEADPLLDIDVLCESVTTLIKLCHEEGIQKDSVSIKHCIDKLKEGFINTSFKPVMTAEAKAALVDSTTVSK